MNSRTAARAVAVLALLTVALSVGAAVAHAAPINITPPIITEITTPQGPALQTTVGYWINNNNTPIRFQWDVCSTTAPSSCAAWSQATSDPWLLSAAPPWLRYARAVVSEGSTPAYSAVFTVPGTPGSKTARSVRPPYSKGFWHRPTAHAAGCNVQLTIYPGTRLGVAQFYDNFCGTPVLIQATVSFDGGTSCPQSSSNNAYNGYLSTAGDVCGLSPGWHTGQVLWTDTLYPGYTWNGVPNGPPANCFLLSSSVAFCSMTGRINVAG